MKKEREKKINDGIFFFFKEKIEVKPDESQFMSTFFLKGEMKRERTIILSYKRLHYTFPTHTTLIFNL